MSKPIGSGTECLVYNSSPGKVYKKYDYNKGPDLDRDLKRIYYLAKKAYKNGIGPKVYGRRKYGYITEKVETIESAQQEDFARKHYDELEKKIQEVFTEDVSDFTFESWHDRRDEPYYPNLGIKDGKLIVIDFGVSYI